MVEIVLDKVTKRYPDGTVAVSEADFRIGDGEFVILFGPSGCGKTTLLNLVAGLEDISSGEVRIDGERVNEKAPRDRDLAMVFQSYALYPHLNVRENMAFPLRLAKVPDAVVRRQVTAVAEMLHLTQHLERKPVTLSGGQRQRVAIGRAIVRRPKALLMDEPLSNLDAKLRAQMRARISELQRQLGLTTLYVTHDQTEAMTLGDRVVVLRGGRVQQIGAARSLYEHPANLFVAAVLGSPPMNFLPGRVVGGTLRCPLGPVPLTDAMRQSHQLTGAGREVLVGIRPEHLVDAAPVKDAPPSPGCVVTVRVQAVEEAGADPYARFTLEGSEVSSVELADVTAEAQLSEVGEPDMPEPDEWGMAEPNHAGGDLLARLSASAAARSGGHLDLWFDPDHLHLFDPDTGENLTASP